MAASNFNSFDASGFNGFIDSGFDARGVPNTKGWLAVTVGQAAGPDYPVVLLDDDMTPIWTFWPFAAGHPSADSITLVASSPSGDIYLSKAVRINTWLGLSGEAHVAVFDRERNPKWLYDAGAGNRVDALAYSRIDSSLIVYESTAQTITKLDADGDVVWSANQLLLAQSGQSTNNGLAIDQMTGDIYCCDGGIKKYDLDGNSSWSISPANSINHIAWSTEEQLLYGTHNADINFAPSGWPARTSIPTDSSWEEDVFYQFDPEDGAILASNYNLKDTFLWCEAQEIYQYRSYFVIWDIVADPLGDGLYCTGLQVSFNCNNTRSETKITIRVGSNLVIDLEQNLLTSLYKYPCAASDTGLFAIGRQKTAATHPLVSTHFNEGGGVVSQFSEGVGSIANKSCFEIQRYNG